MTIKGVDISEVQQTVDFHWLVQQGIQFVIVKCFEGNKGLDGHFEKNVAGALAAGLKVGLYHFIYPLPTDSAHPGRDPKSQAKLHYEATLKVGDIAVHACDMEWPEPQNFSKWSINANFIKQWTLEYLAEYERLSGKRMVLYTYFFYGDYLKLSPEFAKYPLWIANFDFPPRMPYPWTDYVLQQTGGGTTGIPLTLPNGIPTDTDQAKDLSLWDIPIIEVPPPVEPQPEPPPVIENPPFPAPPAPPSASPNFLTVLFQALQNLLQAIFKR
jgi:lysozyme